MRVEDIDDALHRCLAELVGLDPLQVIRHLGLTALLVNELVPPLKVVKDEGFFAVLAVVEGRLLPPEVLPRNLSRFVVDSFLAALVRGDLPVRLEVVLVNLLCLVRLNLDDLSELTGYRPGPLFQEP